MPDDVRRTIEMCPLVNRQNEHVEAVCPPHTVVLLALREIATWGLKLAQQLFARAPRLAQSRLGEPEDLVQELIERYGEGRRIYQWPDWLFDREQPDWVKYV